MNPNQLGRSPFPASASQWMLVGLRGGAAPPPGLNDGDPVTTWTDSSGNGHDATRTGSARPIFKHGILNGKPVVRFTTAGQSGLNLATAIPGDGPWTIFTVMKANGGALVSLSTSGAVNFPCGPLEAVGPGAFYFGNKATYSTVPADYSAAWHVFAVEKDLAGGSAFFLDGTTQSLSGGANISTGNFDTLGYNPLNPAPYSDGDLAEVIIYGGQLAIRAKLLLVLTLLISTGQIPSTEEADALLAAGDMVGLEAYLIEHGVPVEEARDTLEPMAVGDRANIEKYLGTKYGLAVTSGGTAVDPSTVAGLAGWWKADSLGT
jgi:hypothetical protein